MTKGYYCHTCHRKIFDDTYDEYRDPYPRCPSCKKTEEEDMRKHHIRQWTKAGCPRDSDGRRIDPGMDMHD